MSEPRPTADEMIQAKITVTDLDNACLSYRHDFGLLSAEEKSSVRFQAYEWLIAWRKSLGFLKVLR